VLNETETEDPIGKENRPTGGRRFVVAGVGEVLWDVFPEGARLGGAPTNFASHAGFKVRIVDTVGAGDAFTAALVIGVLQGKNFNAINEEANRLASAVCTRSGAMSAFRPSGKYV